jgi:hypothetical protein
VSRTPSRLRSLLLVLTLSLFVSSVTRSSHAQPLLDGGAQVAPDAGRAVGKKQRRRALVPADAGAAAASDAGERDAGDTDAAQEEAPTESDADEEAEEAAPEPETVELPPAPVELPAFVQENLPEKVVDVMQGAVDQMVQSRAPPNALLYGIFGLPRSRFGSGTTWLPDASPLHAAVPHMGKWGLLFHGNLYTGYNWYSSDRGGQRFMGRNTLMGALFRTFKQSELLLRLAMSFEPLTIGPRGYPQILQTGQTSNGKRIHDTMYALDFFRELAVTYQWEVTPKWAGLVYAALAGEPALGPVTFTQRVSASADPLAPLGFQAQEASHASFGVLTVGAFTRKLKLEASWFNGEVPGRYRFRISLRKPDSYSLRATWNPGAHWSMQASYGFLEKPVPSDPRHQHRVSASATYTQWTQNDAGLAATLSFAERVDTDLNVSTAFMAEAYWNIDGNHAVFTRWELLQKSGQELVLKEPGTELYAVGSISGGYVYYFGPYITLAPGLGVRGSINPMEDDLAREYGSRVAYGVMAFAQLRTSALPVPSRVEVPVRDAP